MLRFTPVQAIHTLIGRSDPDGIVTVSENVGHAQTAPIESLSGNRAPSAMRDPLQSPSGPALKDADEKRAVLVERQPHDSGLPTAGPQGLRRIDT